MSGGQSSPVWEALLLDVPYLIDSLFRWLEFRGNRTGVVNLDDNSRPFTCHSVARWPYFYVCALIALFSVFGPTFESLCGPLGNSGFRIVQIVLLVVLYAWSTWLALYLIAALLTRLAQRLREKPQLLQESAQEVELLAPNWTTRMLEMAPGFMPQGWFVWGQFDRILAVIPELGAMIGALNRRGRLRMFTNIVVVFLMVLIAIAPFLFALSLIGGDPDPETCRALDGSGPRVLAQVVACFVMVVSAWFCLSRRRWKPIVRLLAVISSWTLVMGLLWGFFAPAEARELDPGPYRHVYPILLAILGVIAISTWVLAKLLFGDSDRVWIRWRMGPEGQKEKIDWVQRFRERTAAIALIETARQDPPIESFRNFAALLNGVGSRPLQALLLPSFVALMSTTKGLLTWTAIAAAVSVILLFYGTLSARWQAMVLYIERTFLIGTALPVSVLVIALGILRLFDVQYVSTILDAAPFGTIFSVVIMSYLLAWFFEYWINRWPAEHLLRVLGVVEKSDDYVALPRTPVSSSGEPEAVGRYLALHGTGRLCAQGWFARPHASPWERPRESMFSTYGLLETFKMLSRHDDDPDVVNGLERRLRVYFNIINFVVVIVAVGLWSLHRSYVAPLALDPVIDVELRARSNQAPNNLLTALQLQHDRPALIVAASGGGTRAALYTAHALEGLGRIGRARDIVLISGVSGGGVTGAVFVHRFSELTDNSSGFNEAPWRKLREDVAKPFISDVLDGVGELRIAGSTALGTLLGESFQRRLFEGKPVDLTDLVGPKVMLNTTISGHPAEDSMLLAGRAALPKMSTDNKQLCNAWSRPFSSLSGSRLVFTTLTSDAGFPVLGTGPPDMRLAYVVVRASEVVGPEKSQLPLAAAAALNANFPPVFPNARVRTRQEGREICPNRSYFVTDGGATENLGLVSALYALRGAIEAAPTAVILPPIHLVAIEASAVTYDYKADRGIGAATGGSKERINGALTEELLKGIHEQLARRNQGEIVRLHYLPLPVAFRSRGGLGTHWMYAKSFRVSNPLVANMPGRFQTFWEEKLGLEDEPYYQTLDQDDILVLWTAMFDANGTFCEQDLKPVQGSTDDDEAEVEKAEVSPRARQVHKWICGRTSKDERKAKPDWQVEAWASLVRELKEP